MEGGDVASVLAAGAGAAQLGTAFLLCPEAGTAPVHRAAIARPAATTLTRAFTGRRARGIVNAWTDAVGTAAPSAYPELHHLTAPLRAHGRAVGDPDLVNLWAGTRHHLAREMPAAALVAELAR
jgi:nitronate monooxygenase